jgi:glycosidase
MRRMGRWARAAGAASLLLAAGCAAAAPRGASSPPPPAAPAPAIQPTPSPAPPLATPEATVRPQESWADAVLYFVVLDRFADGDAGNNVHVDRSAKGAFHGGDLAGLTRQLDEIASLGATALWITPVVQQIPGFVTGAGLPDWAYHGYWADDFYKLDRRFGSEADLKTLVDEAHRRGMKVLLDVVYNHAGYGSHYLTDPRTKDWLRSSENGGCGGDDLTTCVSGLPDWKTELPQVDAFLLDAHLGLAKRVGVDGFRLDTVKHVDHPFWRAHRQRTRKELGPGFFLIGEVWGGDAQSLDPWFAGDEMDAGFDFSFQGSTVGFLLGRGRTAAYDHYLQSREKVRAGHFLSPYLSSHDVPGALSLLGGDKALFRLAALLELTAQGIPMIYYGEEVGRPGGDWPDNRSDMPWGERKILPGAGLPRDEALRADYRKLIAIRRAHRALSRGSYSALSTEGDRLVFVRRDPESKDAVVVAVNRGASPARTFFPAPAEWEGGPTRDVWNGEDFQVEQERVDAMIPPKGARIFVVERRRR